MYTTDTVRFKNHCHWIRPTNVINVETIWRYTSQSCTKVIVINYTSTGLIKNNHNWQLVLAVVINRPNGETFTTNLFRCFELARHDSLTLCGATIQYVILNDWRPAAAISFSTLSRFVLRRRDKTETKSNFLIIELYTFT